ANHRMKIAMVLANHWGLPGLAQDYPDLSEWSDGIISPGRDRMICELHTTRLRCAWQTSVVHKAIRNRGARSRAPRRTDRVLRVIPSYRLDQSRFQHAENSWPYRLTLDADVAQFSRHLNRAATAPIKNQSL